MNAKKPAIALIDENPELIVDFSHQFRDNFEIFSFENVAAVDPTTTSRS